MDNKTAPVDKPGTSGNVTAEHTSAEHAMQQIHRANNGIRIAVIVALALIVAMLGVALWQLKTVTEQQQTEINARAKNNSLILQRIANSSADTQYLICQIVSVSVPGQPPNPDITRICGPVLAHPPDGKKADKTTTGQQSFLAPGSNQPAETTPQAATPATSNTPAAENQQPTPTPVTPQPQNPIVQTLQGVPIVGPLLSEGVQMVLH